MVNLSRLSNFALVNMNNDGFYEILHQDPLIGAIDYLLTDPYQASDYDIMLYEHMKYFRNQYLQRCDPRFGIKVGAMAVMIEHYFQMSITSIHEVTWKEMCIALKRLGIYARDELNGEFRGWTQAPRNAMSTPTCICYNDGVEFCLAEFHNQR